MSDREYAALIARSWPRTIGAGVLAVLLAVAAINLWLNEHRIWACIVGFLAIPAAFGGVTSGSAHCLNCGWKFTGQFHRGSFNQCPECHKWHQYCQGKLVLVAPDFVADEPEFSVSLDLLKSPGDWRLPWPSMCCVCHKSGTNIAEIRIDQAASSQNILGMQAIRSFRFNFGHCAAHKKGVDLWPGELKFRSHAYWSDFYEMNKKAG